MNSWNDYLRNIIKNTLVHVLFRHIHNISVKFNFDVFLGRPRRASTWPVNLTDNALPFDRDAAGLSSGVCCFIDVPIKFEYESFLLNTYNLFVLLASDFV